MLHPDNRNEAATFSHMVGTDFVPYVWPNVWEVEQTTGPVWSSISGT